MSVVFYLHRRNLVKEGLAVRGDAKPRKTNTLPTNASSPKSKSKKKILSSMYILGRIGGFCENYFFCQEFVDV